MPCNISFSRTSGPFIIKENAGTGLKNVCCGDRWQITVHGTQFYNPRYHWLKDKQSWSTFFCPCTSIPRWPCSSKQKVDLNLIMTSVLSHHLSDKKKNCVLVQHDWILQPLWMREWGDKTNLLIQRDGNNTGSSFYCKNPTPEIFVFTFIPSRAHVEAPLRFQICFFLMLQGLIVTADC